MNHNALRCTLHIGSKAKGMKHPPENKQNHGKTPRKKWPNLTSDYHRNILPKRYPTKQSQATLDLLKDPRTITNIHQKTHILVSLNIKNHQKITRKRLNINLKKRPSKRQSQGHLGPQRSPGHPSTALASDERSRKRRRGRCRRRSAGCQPSEACLC